MRSFVQNIKLAQRPTWSQAVWLALAAIVLAALLIAKLAPVHGGLFDGFNPFLIEMVKHHWFKVPADHRRVLIAHKAFLVLIALTAGALAVLPPTVRSRLESFRSGTLTPFLMMLLTLFFGWAFFSFPGTERELLGGPVLCLGLWACACLSGKIPRWMATAAALSAIAAACLPGFFLRPDLFELPTLDILQIQEHYTVSFSFADQLATGITPGKEWALHYGVIGPTLLGLIERATGIWTFRNLVNLVQVSQVVLLILACVILRRFAGRSEFAALAAFATVLPWYHCNQLGISYPNHSGSRLLVVFAAVAALSGLSRLRPARLSFAMGLAAGFAILYNFETGFTLAIGLALALWLRRKSAAGGAIAQAIVPFLYMAMGAAAAYAAFVALFLSATGALPLLLSPAKLAFMFRVPQIITIEGVPAAVAVLMFAHAAYIVLRTALTEPERITHRQALKAGLALTLLIWAIYYFNRPYFAYLAGCFALYSIHLVDTLRVQAAALRGRRRYLPGALLGAFALALVVVPFTIMSYREAAPSYVKVWERLRLPRPLREWAEYRSEILSGVSLPREMGAFLRAKSLRLKELHGEGPLRYVTVYSLIVPKVSGVQQDFPYVDPYFGVNFVKQHLHYLAELKKDGPLLIAVDDPECDPVLRGEGWYSTYVRAVEQDLARTYRLRGRDHGWSIWERRPDR